MELKYNPLICSPGIIAVREREDDPFGRGTLHVGCFKTSAAKCTRNNIRLSSVRIGERKSEPSTVGLVVSHLKLCMLLERVTSRIANLQDWTIYTVGGTDNKL